MKLLVVIPFCKTDGVQAEQLCDWIFQLAGKIPIGHVLLIAAGDTHPELVTKVQIAAEVAFESVTIVVDKVNSNLTQPKVERVNRMFLAAAEYAASRFKWPFIFLEPDAIPVKRGWLGAIDKAYSKQPKRFMGSFMRYQAADKSDKLCLARVGVYPHDAANTMRQFCEIPAPFNMVAGESIIPMAVKTGLFQQLEIKSEADLSKIREDALIVHGDKSGLLIQRGEIGVAEGAPALASA